MSFNWGVGRVIDIRVEGLEAAHAITLHSIQYIRVLRKNHFLSAQSIATIQLRQRPVFSRFCTWTRVSTARFGLVRGCAVGDRIAVLEYRIIFGASGPTSTCKLIMECLDFCTCNSLLVCFVGNL